MAVNVGYTKIFVYRRKYHDRQIFVLFVDQGWVCQGFDGKVVGRWESLRLLVGYGFNTHR